MQDVSKTHFELFDLPATFTVDLALLDRHYRQLQSEVHPDRFAAASSAEKLRSIQLATQANEAYRTLKEPTARARYLLKIHGVDTQEESNTAMPADFLMLQMEWREAMDDARTNGNIDALEYLLNDMRTAAKALQAELVEYLEAASNLTKAAETVRKLSFIDKIHSDIEQIMARLEDSHS